MPRISVRNPKGEEHEIVLSGPLYMGRHRDCDVILADTKVSRRHIRLIPVGHSYVVEDLGSANGTFVNGARAERRILANGDVVEVGPFRIRYIGEPGEDLVGQVIEGYRIIRRLGAGGMGTVYLAEQITMGRLVALKILNEDLAEDPAFIEDFINEARLAGRLNHPNIVRVFDFGSFQSTYFISMEYVDGRPVRELLEETGRLEPEHAVRMLKPVADALAHAHSHGVIHQDIKPQNIMISKDKQVKLADLGLARRAGTGPDERHQKAIVATPHYMSPEQGKRISPDARSDIYSFGATFFHLVTGRVPFDGPNSLAIITKHLHQEPPNPKQFDMTLPDSLCDLILKCLRKTPEERYQSAEELREALDGLDKDLAAYKRHREHRRRAASSALSRKETMRSRHAPQTDTASNLLYPIIIASAVLLVGLFLAISRTGNGGNGDQPDRSVSEILDRARSALEIGNRDKAAELARMAQERTDDNFYIEEARAVLAEVKHLNEADAEEELTLLEGLDPDRARPLLIRFIAKHSGTDAAKRARGLLAGKDSVENDSATTTDDAGTRKEDTETIVKAALEAAAEGDYLKAVGLLESHLGRTNKEEDKERVGTLVLSLRKDAATAAAKTLASAKQALEQNAFKTAASLLRKAEKEVVDGDSHNMLKVLRAELAQKTVGIVQAAEKEITNLLSSYRFSTAKERSREAIETVGADDDSQLRKLEQVAALASSGFQSLISAINASPNRGFHAKIRGNPEALFETVLADTKGVKARLRQSGKEMLLDWTELPAEALTELVHAYLARLEPLPAAALLAARGDRKAAMKLLSDRKETDAEVLRSFMSAGNDKSTVITFADITSLTSWRSKSGKWALRDGILAEESGGESALEYSDLLKPGATGTLRVTATLRTGSGEGFVSATLACEAARVTVYLDEEGARCRLRASGEEEPYKIASPKQAGEHTFGIEISRGKMSARVDKAVFPTKEVFGLEGAEFQFSVAGMGETYELVRVEIERK